MPKKIFAESVETSSTHRLRRALVAIRETCAEPTATALCEQAGISRNALYRYHRDIVDELHLLKNQCNGLPVKIKDEVQRLKSENEALKIQVAQITSLVDHYFAAWQESENLLRRRERELADLRKKNVHALQAKPDRM